MATGYFGTETNPNLSYWEDDRITVNGYFSAWDTYNGYNLPNGNFEIDLSGWRLYNDGVVATPVNGIDGTATIILTRSTSLPLMGNASGVITKGAVNGQGEGVSYDFTIHRGRLNSLASLSFLYETSSNYVTNDIKVYVYDVTNNSFITLPSNSLPASLSSTEFHTTFTPSTSTSYRLIFHIGSTNANAWTYKVDGILVKQSEITIYDSSTRNVKIGNQASTLFTPLDNVHINTSLVASQKTGLMLLAVGGDVDIASTIDIDFAMQDGNTLLSGIPQVRIGAVANAGSNTSPDYEARGVFRVATRGEGAGGVLTDRFWVDWLGNVGIGAIPLADKLEVKGNVRINDSSGNLGFQMAFDNVSKTLNFNYVGA